MQSIYFYTAFTEDPPINSFIHWKKLSQGKCFLDFADSTSIWRIRPRDKFIYAATAKPFSSIFMCYILRSCFINEWVSALCHYSFLEGIREKSKALKKNTNLTHWMSLLNECEKRKHSPKIVHELIASKFKRIVVINLSILNWFAWSSTTFNFY